MLKPTPPSLVTIPSSAPIAEINAIIARDGGVIVSDLLSPSLLKEMQDALEPHFEGRELYASKATHGELGDDFFPEGSQRVYALLGKIPDELSKVLRLKVWQGIMEHSLWYVDCVSRSHGPCPTYE